jgi:AraC-like DNA-binding protein
MVDMKTLKLLKHTSNNEETGLNINKTGILEEMNPGIVDRPEGTGDYFFVYIYDKSSLGTAESIINAEAESFILWEPGQRQYYGNSGNKWLHSWLHFSGKFAERILKKNSIPINKVTGFKYPAIIESPLVEIYDEHINHEQADAKIVENIFENMFRKISRKLGSNEQYTVPEKFSKLKIALETNLKEEWSLEKMADVVYLSVPHFCSEWKRFYRVAPIKYLIELRLNHALYLLKDINLSIAEIAEETGFSDIYYFSKLFKKNFGKSPSKMRK